MLEIRSATVRPSDSPWRLGLLVAVTCLATSGCQFLSSSENNASTNNGAMPPPSTTPTTNAMANNGAVNQTTVTPPGNNQTTPTPNNQTTPASNQTTPDPGMSCVAPDPTPLRRLSHFEYWNTIHALYPGVSFPDIDLPADNRPHEFDNDADALVVNTNLVERYLDVAKALVEALEQQDRLAGLVDCAPGDGATREEIAACGEAFVRQEGARLFRRPLTDGQVEKYSRLFRDEDLAEATFAQLQGFTLRLMLAAPEFLYRFERGAEDVNPGESVALDAYALASRLSYFIWGTMPDEELMSVAADGSLLEPTVLRAQAERMLADERAKEVFLHFHEQWLDLERLEDVVKKSEEEYNQQLRNALHHQGMMFVEEVLYKDAGTIEDLFASPRSFYDAHTAHLYGEMPPGDGEWVEISPPERAGWLTQPSFLAGHGHPDKPSPVLRGTFVLERVLCKGVGAPPPNAEAMGAAKADEITGPLTNREFYDLTTNSELPCSGCHVRINPPGYALESFDTMGRWREVEPNGLPIDTTGTLDDLSFESAADLAGQLGTHPDVESCVTQKWLRYAWAGGPLESSTCLIDDVLNEVGASAGAGGSPAIRDLQLAIVTHPWFALYTAPETEAMEE